MTTTTAQPDKMTAAELREAFAQLRTENDEIRTEIHQLNERLGLILDGLAMATASISNATPSAAAEFIADTIDYGFMDGKPVYKAKGGRFTKFGVRIWPEVLPLLGLDAKKLELGENKIEPTTYTVEMGASGLPRKVIGKK